MTPDESRAAVLDAIIHAHEAWTERAPLEGEHGAALDDLAADGMVEDWDRPDGVMVTLSPFGAWSLGVKLAERGSQCTPYWREMPHGTWFLPESYPRHEREVGLEFAANVEAPADEEPEFLLDEYSGEPIMLFQGVDADGIANRPNGVLIFRQKAKGGRGNKRAKVGGKR